MLVLLKQIYDVLEQIFKILNKKRQCIAEQAEPIQVSSQNSQQEFKKILEAEDVQQKLGISRATYYRYVKDEKLVPRKLGTRHYYYPEDLDEQLEESKRKGRL